MNKRLKIIFLLPILLILCSFTRMGTYDTVGLTLCCFTEFDDESLNIEDPLNNGHCFVIVENNRSYSLDLGHFSIGPFESCTVGLWNSAGNTIYHQSGDGILYPKGVYFNREAVIFNQPGYSPSNCIKLYREVPTSTFISRMYADGDNNTNNDTHFLVDKANTYHSAYNNARFAVDFFETAINETLIAQYSFVINVYHSMQFVSGVTYNNSIFSKFYYYKYSVSGGCVTYDD